MDFVNDTTLVYVHVAYFSPLSVVSRTIILFGIGNAEFNEGSGFLRGDEDKPYGPF